MAQSSVILPIPHFTEELMLSWNTVPCFTVISFTCVMLFYKLILAWTDDEWHAAMCSNVFTQMKLIQSFAAFLSHIQVLYFWMLATLQCAINCPILAFSLWKCAIFNKWLDVYDWGEMIKLYLWKINYFQPLLLKTHQNDVRLQKSQNSTVVFFYKSDCS